MNLVKSRRIQSGKKKHMDTLFREDHVEDDRLGNLFATFKFSFENPRLSWHVRKHFSGIYLSCVYIDLQCSPV